MKPCWSHFFSSLPRDRKWELKQACWKREKSLAIRCFPSSAYIAGTLWVSHLVMARFIALDSPNIEYGRQRWRLPEFKMAGWKPEVEITFEWKQMATRSQRLPPHFRPCPTQIWHWRHDPTSTDMRNAKLRRHQTEVEITFERKEMATRPKRLPPHLRRRPIQICHWRHGPRSPDIGCFHIRFVSPHFLSPMSADVGPCRPCISSSGMV